jgi:hypothetical protein
VRVSVVGQEEFQSVRKEGGLRAHEIDDDEVSAEVDEEGHVSAGSSIRTEIDKVNTHDLVDDVTTRR